jgi:hypothetical protein
VQVTGVLSSKPTREMSANLLSTRFRAVVRPGRRPRLTRMRVALADGATTLHVASYPREAYVPRIIALERPEQLLRWCRAAGVRHAVVGGFFARPQYDPLGALRIGGEDRWSVPFDSPWGEMRACVHVADGSVRITRRDELSDAGGDLLQAGPLLVSEGRRVVEDGVDTERRAPSTSRPGRYGGTPPGRGLRRPNRRRRRHVASRAG